MKKNIVVTILASFLFIFSFLPDTHAATYTAGVVTAYTGAKYGHGSTLFPNEAYKTVAVHKKSNNQPIFNFGTNIVTQKALYLDGYGNQKIFEVTDTDGSKRKSDKYWFDVYFGTTTTKNHNNAVKFGEKNKNVTYSTM